METPSIQPVPTADELMIEAEFQALLNDYLNSKHRKKVEIITKAFHFANNAHKGARRRSGEPYIMHPLAVARIVAKEIGLGSTSICAALLHDVVEDTDYTVDDIAIMFTPKIAQLVDGLTKISGGIFGEQASQQAENFRKLLLTMPDDIRVIIIKMADRLHNMRTLESMPQTKQFKIAGETLYIYAPLAHRLGLNRIKSELEDLSFKYEHPEDYEDIQQKIEATNALRNEIYECFAEPIKEKLDSINFKYEMKARTKSVYGIWNKMQTKNIGFDDVYDLLAVRIVFEPREGIDEEMECWSVYSIVTRVYKLHPERIRDWVSSPKLNGYRGLHVTVMGPNGQWVEVQIRSKKMDEIAEKGFAAHWTYKQGAVEEDNELNQWIRTVKEILENPEPDAIDFLDTVKMNLFSNEIFVCTPKGEFKTLPLGATALDFAFSLHSDIGYTCIGAKVNHKLVPLSHKLQSGDQIEVLNSKSQVPKKEWVNFVTTARAKNKLMLFYRKERRIKMNEGESQIIAFLSANGHKEPMSQVDKLVKHLRYSKRDDFFLHIGLGEVKLNEQLLKALKTGEENPLIKMLRRGFSAGKKEFVSSLPKELIKVNKKELFKLTEEGVGVTYHLSECCNPIPGDDVLGYVTDAGIVNVHQRSCSVAMKLKSGFGNQIVLVSWDEFPNKLFNITIEIAGIDEPGVLNKITKVLAFDFNVSINMINIITRDGMFHGKLGFCVKHVDDVKRLCNSLNDVRQVTTAVRESGLSI